MVSNGRPVPIDPSTVDQNTPLRLSDAAKIAFPFGGMTSSGLRREAKRGNLEIERIAGKDFTTFAAIAAMREKCRIRPEPKATKARRPGPPERVDLEIARAATPLTLERLGKPSAPNWPPSAGRRKPARPGPA